MTKADRSELEDGNRPKPVVVGPDEGSRYWVAGGFDTIRLTGEQTGGALGVTETEETHGAGPPLHIHSREDETYDVVEGSFGRYLGGLGQDRGHRGAARGEDLGPTTDWVLMCLALQRPWKPQVI
jgi:hypothetical protein